MFKWTEIRQEGEDNGKSCVASMPSSDEEGSVNGCQIVHKPVFKTKQVPTLQPSRAVTPHPSTTSEKKDQVNTSGTEAHVPVIPRNMP